MLYERMRRGGLVTAAILGMALFEAPAFAQDTGWDDLISAGRNALQEKNFSEAERQFEIALEAAEEFPADDPRLGKSYNNLAAVYYAQEDYDRAEPLMRRALNQLRGSLGNENTEVAQTMKNLAALYFLRGNRTEAEGLLKEALQILETVHGPNHAFVATVLSNLAGLYQAENRFGEAEPLLARSLRIWEGLLGSDHPDVVRSRTLLAQVRSGLRGYVPNQAVADRGEEPAAADDDEGELEVVQVPPPPRPSQAVIEEPIPEPVDVAEAEPEEEPAPEPVDVADAERGSTAAAPSEAERTSIIRTAQAAVTNTDAADLLEEARAPGEVSYAVYLSTLWSVDEARRYWQALKGVMPEVLGEKRLEIEEVAIDGGDKFYRVLTSPFDSDPEAAAACDEIRAQLRTHDCNVVVLGSAADG